METEFQTTKDWKNFGNKQFVLKRYSLALKAYTVGLSLCNNEDLDLLTNRAAAYLNLEHFGKALEDVNLVLSAQPSHPKAIYRKAKALLGLSRCEEAVQFLNKEISSLKKPTKELQEILERAESMREQQTTGEYDVTEHFYQYYSKIENWAEYVGPVEVQSISGRGRGLVATDNIAEGQLIFNVRAFAIEFHDPSKDPDEGAPDSIEENVMDHPAVTSLHDKGGCILVQKVYERIKEDPELGKELFQLYAGDELGSLDPSKDDCSKPDVARISGIIRYNCFANCCDDNTDTEKASALFIKPSYFNHRCIANSTWKIYGNFIMARTYRAIRKGEELIISYASPTWSYKIRQSLLIDRLGFQCDCELCVLDRQLPLEVIAVREKLQKLALKQQVDFVALNPSSDPTQIYKKFQESSALLLEIIRRLEDMHPNHGAFNVLCVDPLQQLGMKYFGVGEFEKAAKCMERSHSIMKAAGLPHGAVECMLWVVGSYLQLGNMKTAKYWIQVLKKDAILAHGTIKTLKIMGEWVINAMEENNVSL